MSTTPIQDHYPDNFAHCYGCGRLNSDGFHLKSYQEGDETVCRFTPDPKYTGGFPGFLYGGILASLIDCHGAATAAAAKAREDNKPISRFVTASLTDNYLAPTPINTELELKARATEIKGRKVVVEVTLLAAGKVCATGSALMIEVKETD